MQVSKVNQRVRIRLVVSDAVQKLLYIRVYSNNSFPGNVGCNALEQRKYKRVENSSTENIFAKRTGGISSNSVMQPEINPACVVQISEAKRGGRERRTRMKDKTNRLCVQKLTRSLTTIIRLVIIIITTSQISPLNLRTHPPPITNREALLAAAKSANRP